MRKLNHLVAGIALIWGGSAGAADLLEVYQLASENDPELHAAQAGFRAVQEARPQARSFLLPSISVGANAAWNRQDVERSGGPSPVGVEEYGSHGYALNLQQAIFRRDYLVQLEQAESQIAQAAAELGSVEQGVILRVAQAYFALLAAQDTLTFAEAERLAVEQQLNQAQQRFDVGLIAITDVHEAQARFDLAVAQAIAARNQVFTAQEALRAIIGVLPESLAVLTERMALIPPSPADIDQWVGTALQQNLDLLAANAAEQVARQTIQLQRAGRYPNLDLVASHSYSDTTNNPTGSERDDTAIQLQLSIPLYTGGLITSQIRAAVYRHQQAQQGLIGVRRNTEREARDAYLNVVTGISQVRALEQSVTSAETALQATEAGFEVGTRTVVDVLDAQRVLYGARRDLAQARYNYIVSTLRLKQAAGTLDREDVAQVNAWLEENR